MAENPEDEKSIISSSDSKLNIHFYLQQEIALKIIDPKQDKLDQIDLYYPPRF